jgi:copper transport protein
VVQIGRTAARKPLSRFHRPLRGAALALASALVAAGALAPAAHAHAVLQDSTPGHGARLESTPTALRLRFSEPVSPALSRVSILAAADRRRVAATLSVRDGHTVVVVPSERLDVAAYRVEWHVVSTRDGHARAGAFAFGVRTAPIGVGERLEQSPLARDGWLRAAARGLLYGTLVFFAGGLFAAVLLSRSGSPTDWLLPPRAATVDSERARRASQAWRRTRLAGWLAAAFAALVALLEAADAGGALNGRVIDAYLLDTVPGLARLATVAVIVLAAALAGRSRRAASAAATAALLAIAVGGHASAADLRVAAIASDFVHLLAGSLWLGGIAQLAVTWLGPRRRPPLAERIAVMRTVLARFGRVALPAFAVIVVSGLTNAVIELGRPAALWDTAYGRVLAIKIGLVGLIALASYAHAIRLRPRLLAAAMPPLRAERVHWRLLGAEPGLGIAVVAVAALLATFPLPPTQLSREPEAARAATPPAGAASRPGTLPRAGPNELAVAEQAGPWMAAAWIHHDGAWLRGRLRLLDLQVAGVAADVRIHEALQRPCGRGCWDFAVATPRRRIELQVRRGSRAYRVTLPAAWDPASSGRARQILGRAQRAMRALRGVSAVELLSSGPGLQTRTASRLEAPDRFRSVVTSDKRRETVAISEDYWTRTGRGHWEHARSPGDPVRTRDWFTWTNHAVTTRLLAVDSRHGGRIAWVALADPGDPVDYEPPFWFRLRIDLATMRVLAARMIAPGHFMRLRYFSFDTPRRIAPPTTRSR